MGLMQVMVACHEAQRHCTRRSLLLLLLGPETYRSRGYGCVIELQRLTGRKITINKISH
jgi:hypothetical protein